MLLSISYLVGSIPFGFIVTYLIKKIDIRSVGSGNIGATNVSRILGIQWALLVFVLDFLKGFLVPHLAPLFIKNPENYLFVSMAVASVIGHSWPCFLNFKGGKGVATSIGAMSGLGLLFPSLWISLLAAIFVWVALFFILRYVSLASIGASAVFSIVSLILKLPFEIKLLSLFLFLFIVARHAENIKRLIRREEYRF
jgi:glycerol-3-phosphate acyltransferase PlsY